MLKLIETSTCNILKFLNMSYWDKLGYIEHQSKTPTVQTFFAFKVFILLLKTWLQHTKENYAYKVLQLLFEFFTIPKAYFNFKQ